MKREFTYLLLHMSMHCLLHLGVNEPSLIKPGSARAQLQINFKLEMFVQAWSVYHYFMLNLSLISNWTKHEPRRVFWNALSSPKLILVWTKLNSSLVYLNEHLMDSNIKTYALKISPIKIKSRGKILKMLLTMLLYRKPSLIELSLN